MEPTPDTLLVVQPHHLGDVVLSTPCLAALRRAAPATRITILVGRWAEPILKGSPDVDEVACLDLPWLDRSGRATWSDAVRAAGMLRERAFDRVVTLPVSAKTAVFARLCGGRERWGFDVPRSRWAWTHRVAYDERGLVADQYLAMARALGAPPGPVAFRVVPAPEDVLAADRFLAQRGDAVLLAVTAGDPRKLWDPARWAVVGEHAASRGFSVIVNGAASERAYADAVAGAVRGAASIAGAFSPMELAALVGRCRAVIALDSYPAHLAVALGTPLVALYGPTSTPQWRPYPTGRPCEVIEPPRGMPPVQESMLAIEANDVIAALERVLVRGR